MWGSRKKGPVYRKSTDGKETFSGGKIVVVRWSELFQKLLNVHGDIDYEALNNIPQRITKSCLDEIPIMAESNRRPERSYLGEMEFLLKYGSTEETICSADSTN